MGPYWTRILLVMLALAFGTAVLFRSFRSQDANLILRMLLIIAMAVAVYVVVQELVFVTGYDASFAGRPSSTLVAAVRERVVSIEQIDAIEPAALSRIGEAVAGRSIVGLGENHHGVEEYSRTKLQLIRYLHEDHGFNLLLFETPFFDLLPVNEAQTVAHRGASRVNDLYSIWRTETNHELFAYIASTWRTGSPLHVAGIDPKQPGNSSRPCDFLRSVLQQYDPVLAADHLGVATVSQAVFNGSRSGDAHQKALVEATIAHYRGVGAALDALASQSGAIAADDAVRLRIAGQVAVNLAVYAEMLAVSRQESNVLRDRQMADNVAFLREVVVPGARTLIWAHNAHLRRAPERIERGDFYNFFLRWVPAAWIFWPNLGSHLHRRYGDDYYALALSSAGGRTGSPLGHRDYARRPRRNSLEGLLADQGGRAAFLDLAPQGPCGDVFRTTRTQILDSELYWRWIIPTEQYDGIIVVCDVTRARYLY